jgi:hypothetical protein
MRHICDARREIGPKLLDMSESRVSTNNFNCSPLTRRLGRRKRALTLAAAFLVALCTVGTLWRPAWAFSPSAETKKPAQAARDGQHDFDFNIGVWKTHIRRVPDPLSGSGAAIELNGTVTVRKVWGGRAKLEEIEAEGPNGHWEALSLFLYNPQSRQWSQSFLNSRSGELGSPLVGSFHDGRGELYSEDTFKGRTIMVRGVWSDVTPDSHRYTESYSDDGGKTWALSFIGDKTRDKTSTATEAIAPPSDPSAQETGGRRDGRHDFDFDIGTWKTHSTRLLHPLTGSKIRVEMDGVTVVNKVWGGRANIAEYKAKGPAGEVELMALRWYNPTAHQWNVDFATPNVGTPGAVPGVGEFRNGRADLYDQEEINGKFVWVRFSIWPITRDTAQSEQAFSDDGGKTWEVNWINRYTRVSGQ